MIDGVLVVDKPPGMTSHDVVDIVRRAAGQRRVGHTGTLDPDATGVLVVCLGRATRLVRFLQGGRKTYRADIVLGAETTTQDASGEVVAEAPAAAVTRAALSDVLQQFTGRIQQVPPMVSAVKVDGERLYRRAQRGEEVEREPRSVTVHALILESFEPGQRARACLEVTCSAGTYVRTLAHDIGRRLGCGGHLGALRRVANGPFTTDDAHPLDDVRAAGEQGTLDRLVLSPRRAVRGLPAVTVDDAQRVRDVATGRSLAPAGHDGPWAVICGDRLLAVYADRDGQGRPEAVFVQPGDVAGLVARTGGNAG